MLEQLGKHLVENKVESYLMCYAKINPREDQRFELIGKWPECEMLSKLSGSRKKQLKTKKF